MSSFQPPLYHDDVFNSALYDYDKNNTLTIYEADRRYLKLTGGVVRGYTTFDNGISINNGITIDGDVLDLSVITGITNGIVSANKAVIVDTSKDITGFRNLTTTGAISSNSLSTNSISLNGSFNFGSNVNTTMNNNLIITGSSSSPSTTNGIGLAFNPFISTGRIKAYNYVMSSFNAIDINEGAIYIKTDKKIGFGTTSPYQSIDINQSSSTSNRLRFSYTINSVYGEIYSGSDGYLYTDKSPLSSDNSTAIATTGMVQGAINALSHQSLNNLQLAQSGATYGHISDQAQTIAGVKTFSSALLLGNSTDSGRMLSALDSALPNGSTRYFTLGKANTENNQLELSYFHQSDGSSDNALRLGYNGGVLATFKFNGAIGFGTTSPSSSDRLTISGICNSTGGYRSNSIDCINNAGRFIGSGGILTVGNIETTGSMKVGIDFQCVGRIRGDAPLGYQCYNKDDMLTEARWYCNGYNTYFGTQGDSALRFIVNNNTRLYLGADATSSNCCFFGTSTAYPLSILKGDGTYSGSYRFYNSGGSNGTATGTGATVSLYCSSRIVCGNEIDIVSDRRRKQNIRPVDDDLVERFINDIEPRVYNYIGESDLSWGYIAQELLKHGFDRHVQVHVNDEMKEEIDEDGFVSPAGREFSVNTGFFIPLLHKKVKKLNNEIEDLKLCIKEQADMIHKLIEKMNTLI